MIDKSSEEQYDEIRKLLYGIEVLESDLEETCLEIDFDGNST